MPLGSSSRSPGMSWSGACPSTRSQAVPAVTAWRAAPVPGGRSSPHGAPARTLASNAPRTRPRSSTSARGSTRRTVPIEPTAAERVRRSGKNSGQLVISIPPPRTYGSGMNLSTSTPVVTGATGGLGRHLVDELLERGAPKVFALARDTSRIRQDPRIVPVAFDLLDAGTILAAARRAADATLLINNASTAEFAGPLDAAPDAVDREMAVNYHGTYAAIRAFVPVLEATGGRIVNVLSLLSLASSPPMT